MKRLTKSSHQLRGLINCVGHPEQCEKGFVRDGVHEDLERVGTVRDTSYTIDDIGNHSTEAN